ncbi:hypothetical protein AD006_00605 [Pseudonocardia sp. EC080610-09]|uniref:UPF0182 family protein n=1 Tax=unclassified Pseudonocardia TaxID=2619320 RepID=UPI0006CB1AF0|nr:MULTISPECIES: UPF0182 family protein [unclassified Pseudonocardia]ALE74856.1 hypothetical protein FRP1_21430 [Pseudonocardia sp. EC080625-04]ALL74192.1 hypothetical protein AD006_00605 [Pseudonocardia sp. EC080610-09]ALL81216.1 hypothetical protein AD017_08430 [Pseudonocardia sp. EC080619-01]
MRPPVGAPSLTRRTRILLVAAGVLVVLLLGGSRLLNFYVDYLWFGEVGFRSVQLTRLFTQIVLFGVVGLVVGGLVALTLWLAYRYRPVFVPVSGPEDPVARYRTTIIQRLRLFAVGVPVVIGVVAGLAAPVQWQTVQMFLYGTPFGQADPEFGNDISFYAFTLPFLRMSLNWLFVAVAICFVLALVTHYVFGGIRLSGRSGFVSTAARAQLAVLAGVFVLLKAVAYWFDRYDLLWSNRNSQTFFGATYTDLNAVLPAKLILLIIAVICALAFFVAAFRQNLQIPAVAVVMLVISSILVGTAFPLVLQQFVVAPNANEREAPSIERNIEATRNAFGIGPDKVDIQPYAGESEATPAQVRQDTDTVENIRLLDPGKLNRTFTQLQQRRNFYGFAPNLDIDRYTVGGETRDYVVAAREMDANALVGNQQDWINRHLVYTHGNGFVSAPANQVNAALEDTGGQGGLPLFSVSDTQTEGRIPVDQPRIYYGELLDNQYSIVGAEQGTAPREYDSDEAQYTYTGAGGVPIGGIFDRAVFALAYGERNILFNSSINDQSKIMYVRNPRDRVQAVAPWLKLDNDPYPAVVDGRIQWIVDGYTTLQDYPYAERVQLGDATSDSRIGPGGQQLPNETVSYLRNSVKATVDAYDGTVKLYAFDEQDPVLQTWQKAFPGTVEPRSAITPDLQAHLRYPEDQFKVQRELLTRYHVDNPGEFFSTVSFWDVPSDPTVQGGGNGGAQDAQPPYYLYAGLPGQDGASFQLTSALVSLRRQFLASYVSASSDPDTYGQITVLQLPNETQTLGPQQVQAQFLGSPEVSQELNLLRQNQTTIDYGNLLTLPVAGGLLYVEPVYIERAGQDSSYPQLARVLVSYGGRVGYDASLSAALDQVFGAGAGAGAGGAAATPGQPAPQTPAQGATPGTPATPGAPNAAQAGAAQEIRTALNELKAAQQSGDFAKQGEALAELDRAVSAFQNAGG